MSTFFSDALAKIRFSHQILITRLIRLNIAFTIDHSLKIIVFFFQLNVPILIVFRLLHAFKFWKIGFVCDHVMKHSLGVFLQLAWYSLILDPTAEHAPATDDNAGTLPPVRPAQLLHHYQAGDGQVWPLTEFFSVSFL